MREPLTTLKHTAADTTKRGDPEREGVQRGETSARLR